MRSLQDISKERDAMRTIVSLTSAFEGIASLHILQIRDQVMRSQAFFGELWQIYRQIRVDELFHFGRAPTAAQPVNKELLILITSEGGLSGDIDQRLIQTALTKYRPAANDIIVVGHHGSVLLAQSGVAVAKSFKLPARDRDINVLPLVAEIQRYTGSTVYYQHYASLAVQQVMNIAINAAVEELAKNVKPSGDLITETNYIFEPSTYAVVSHLERTMMQVALSQVILDSKLAQYASRFRAMTVAHSKSGESLEDLQFLFAKSRRRLKDERLKEIVNGLKGSRL